MTNYTLKVAEAKAILTRIGPLLRPAVVEIEPIDVEVGNQQRSLI